MRVFDRARRAAPLVLRVGLGILWIVSGPLSFWLGHTAAALDPASRPGLARLASPDSLFWLHTAEVALGVSLISGVWVRGLAVLQVAFVAVASVAAVRTGPGTDIGFGFLGRASALLAGALALVSTGGGPQTLAAWLTRSRTVRRHRGHPLPLLGPVRGLAWVVGCLTAMAGMGTALEIDRCLITRGVARYAWMEGLVVRRRDHVPALAAMRGREARHVQLLRDAGEEPRTTRTRRR